MSKKKSGNDVSRRNFFRGTGAGIAAAQITGAELEATPRLEHNSFQPNSKPEQLSTNLFLLEDTCNVYLIRRGERALLIDFGSGRILDFLRDLGVSKIDWILHTHHHPAENFSPGHTNYQKAMFVTIDGTRVAFTGDAFFNNPENPQSMRHNLIYRNEVKTGDHRKSIRNILDFEPQMIAPGHGKPFHVDREMALRVDERAKKQDAFFRELIADPDTDMGADPSWVRISPYQMFGTPGAPTRIHVHVHNHRSRQVKLECILVLPKGWSSTPAQIAITAEPKGTAVAEAVIQIPAGWSGKLSRTAIALDVMADGRYLGQLPRRR